MLMIFYLCERLDTGKTNYNITSFFLWTSHKSGNRRCGHAFLKQETITCDEITEDFHIGLMKRL
jgi:hypothetical protein